MVGSEVVLLKGIGDREAGHRSDAGRWHGPVSSEWGGSDSCTAPGLSREV